ncbi:MAG: hypothetical protein RBS43_10705, partial [Candidatus Cloacimonas sp.]|nr:hypothetical protein [Candidatus Cloacimonas sp.]
FATISDLHYLPAYQDIGNKRGFWRLSLSLLVPAYHRGKLEFLAKCGLWADLMLLSCFTDAPDYTMHDVWTQHLAHIKDMISAPPTAWEKAAYMAINEQIPSHSEAYRIAYHPHYRVVYPYIGNLMQDILNYKDTLKELS